MTALEQLAALRAIMGERAEIDSKRTLARRYFQPNITSQPCPLSPLLRHHGRENLALISFLVRENVENASIFPVSTAKP
jgi:hypothetical protein